jgi:hypothetical protein
MNTIGVLLLAAATATGSGGGKAHVGFKRWLRPHAVVHGAPPADGMVDMAAMTGAMGPDGGAAGANAGRRFPNVRSQIFFVEPAGMQVGWQTAASGERVYLPAQIVAPARYNFTQGYIYRLKVSNIPNLPPGMALYPTLEVAPSTPETDAYLTHNPIPVQFTQEDFDQVRAGNFVTKVIYLPDPKYQELAVAGVETLVSTRLEPGVDPILEADRRGTILLIIRLGGIDLEMPGGAPAGGVINGIVTGPAMDGDSLPLGPSPAPLTMPAGDSLPSTPVDTIPAAPVNPAPSLEPAPAEVPAAPAPGDLETPEAPAPGIDAPAAPDADELIPAPPAPGGDEETPGL